MNSPKERPILFSGAMVRAILEGRKIQTRRVVKPQPSVVDVAGLFRSLAFKGKRGSQVLYPNGKDDVLKLCPYGATGDRLWVRETWKPCDCGHDICKGAVWRADYVQPEFEIGWKPSIHMPRWASRITLEITAVRVERLNQMQAHDAMHEGVHWVDEHGYTADGKEYFPGNPIHAFQHLWESINGPESWDANPWVWVLEFKRVEA